MSRCVSVNMGLFSDSMRFKVDNDGSDPQEYVVSEDELVNMLEWLALQRSAGKDAKILKMRKEADAMYAQGDKRGAQKLHDEAAALGQQKRLGEG